MIGRADQLTPPRRGRIATHQGAALLVLVGCAFSAGIHFALVPSHAEESARLGLSFGVAGVLLLALSLASFVQPRDTAASLVTALLLASLLGAYLLSRSVGLPWLGHGREPFDAIGVLTKLVELAALLASLHLYIDNRRRPRPLLETRSST
jgi:hypothetical protein